MSRYEYLIDRQMRAFDRFLDHDDRVLHYTDDVVLSDLARKKAKEAENRARKKNIFGNEDNTLVNEENYWIYSVIAHGEPISIHTDDITKDTWKQHYTAIFNILKDGIFTEYVQRYKVNIVFHDGPSVNLCIVDYYINLIMWNSIVQTGSPIYSYHIVFQDEFRDMYTKRYIDAFIIDEYREKITIIELSNVIVNMLDYFHDLDDFSDYLSNTLNLYDSAELMVKDEVFNSIMHSKYSGLPVDRVDDAIMKNANISIEHIKHAKHLLGYDHCLSDIWRANSGIKTKQYAEFQVSLGNKPDGKGGIFPVEVDTSFINGGISNPVYYFIESSTSRIAQIEKFKNVSRSGTLARIMGLSTMDSYLHPDESYDCHTKHLIPIVVKTADHLKHLNFRWYRLVPGGREMCINYRTDTHLIGKTIYLRSPTTCVSAAKGLGVCYKCYGKLAYSNRDSETGFGINIGRIASESITSKQTQTQLSVKHILKAVISKINWCEEFYTAFEMDNNIIEVNSSVENLNDFRININTDDIESDNDLIDGSDVEDAPMEEAIASSSYDEYITEFELHQKSTNATYRITTESGEKLFITKELNAVIKHRVDPTDDKVIIPLSVLKDIPIFIIKIQNNEISKIMVKLKNLFNRTNEVRGKTIHELLQELMDVNIEGDMGISSIHYEIVLMNQIKSGDDVLENPDWTRESPSYRILTIDEALTKNPSVTISLSYQKITKALYTPLTFKKYSASFMDLFFHPNPQSIIRDLPTKECTIINRKPGTIVTPIMIDSSADKYTADNDTDNDTGIIDFEE